MRYSAATFVPVIGNQKGWRVLDWTPRVSVSGPIKAGRAWFTNNANGEFHQYVVPELPRGEDQSWRARVSDHLHAQVNPTPTNMLHASALVSMAWGRNGGLSALDPVSTTLDTRSRQVLFNLRDQQMLAGGALFEVGYGSNRTFLRQEPKGRAPYLSTPEGRGGNHYFDGRQESSRDQVLANLFLPAFTLAGAHQIKTGVGVDRLGYDQEIGRTEIRLFDAALAPIRTIAFEGSGTLSASNVEVGAYVQDTWRMSSRVVAQLGVRADWDDLVSAWGASPRLGIAWSPFGDDRHARLRRIRDLARCDRLHLFSRADDQRPINTFFTRTPAPPETPPLVLSKSFRSTFVIPEQLSSPYARTWSLTDRSPAAIESVRARAGVRSPEHERPVVLRHAVERARHDLHAVERAARALSGGRGERASDDPSGIRLVGELHAVARHIERGHRHRPGRLRPRRAQRRSARLGHAEPGRRPGSICPPSSVRSGPSPGSSTIAAAFRSVRWTMRDSSWGARTRTAIRHTSSWIWRSSGASRSAATTGPSASASTTSRITSTPRR